ncbi:MAG: helix-turn-helix transcriptional regulator [Eggerthellaceae bacterium]|nr:helix-turn-helix transcriptional regulator [Eggerthellaceae bacterium]
MAFMNLKIPASAADPALRSIPLAFLAVGFARAWLALLFANPVVAVPVPVATAHVLFDCGYAAVALAAAVLVRRFVPLNARPAAPALSLGLMLASSAFALAAVSGCEGASALGAVASVAGGVGFVLFTLANTELYATLSTLRMVLCLSLSYVLAGFLAFFGNGMAPLQLAVLLVTLPLAAVACLRRAWRSVPDARRPHAVVPRFSYPWKIYVLVGLYYFAYGLREAQFVAGAGRGSTAATVIVMAAVFLSVWFFADRLQLMRVSRAPMLFMVCGFLLVPAQSVLGDALSSFLISISFTLMVTFVFILLCSMARRTGVPAPVLMAPAYAMQLLSLAGMGVSEALPALGLSSMAQSTATAVLVAVLIGLITLLLLSERRWDAHWTVSIDDGTLEEAARREEEVAARCDSLAEGSGLSPRETEILQLLARKRTMASIARDLYIAEGTVKAHVRHIYEKTGAANRKELYELLGVE